MLLELVLALGLGQQDTLLPQPKDFSVYDEYTTSITCADWTAVRSSRADANKAGFGSLATLQPDGSYELNFVFKGNEAATSSQLNRLNETLSTSLTFVGPLVKTQAEKTFVEQDVTSSELKKGYQINVSSDFKKTPIPAEASQIEKLVESTTSDDIASKVLSSEFKHNSSIQKEAELSEPQKNSLSFDGKKDRVRPITAIQESKESTGISEKEVDNRELRESSDPLYAIIFGSFKKSNNAVKFAASLGNEEVQIFYSNSVYRVGLAYEHYPASELREIKKEFPKVWLLRND